MQAAEDGSGMASLRACLLTMETNIFDVHAMVNMPPSMAANLVASHPRVLFFVYFLASFGLQRAHRHGGIQLGRRSHWPCGDILHDNTLWEHALCSRSPCPPVLLSEDVTRGCFFNGRRSGRAPCTTPHLDIFVERWPLAHHLNGG